MRSIGLQVLYLYLKNMPNAADDRKINHKTTNIHGVLKIWSKASVTISFIPGENTIMLLHAEMKKKNSKETFL